MSKLDWLLFVLISRVIGTKSGLGKHDGCAMIGRELTGHQMKAGTCLVHMCIFNTTQDATET